MGILRIQTRLAMEWEFIVALVIAIPIKLAREGKGLGASLKLPTFDSVTVPIN